MHRSQSDPPDGAAAVLLGSTPTLDAGLTLLETPGGGALHRLVVDELGRRDGRACWVDARNRASTYALYEAAGDRDHLLDDLRIARAFTAYQHHELVRRTVREVDADTDLLVVPRVAALYRDGDVPAGEARAMLRSTLATLAELADACDLAVLVTRPAGGEGRRSATGGDRLTALVDDAVDRTLTCESTPFGLRFDGEGVEQYGYYCRGHWQTTIPYWVDLCGSVPAFDRTTPESIAADALVADGWATGPTEPGLSPEVA